MPTIKSFNRLLSSNLSSFQRLLPPSVSQESTIITYSLLPFQLDWQSLYEAFFIIHLQQPAVRDNEWPLRDNTGFNKSQRNRLPHILALLLIHELIGTLPICCGSSWPGSHSHLCSILSQVGPSRSAENDSAAAQGPDEKHTQVWVRRRGIQLCCER